MISISEKEAYTHNSDIYEKNEAEELGRILNLYEIDLQPYKPYEDFYLSHMNKSVTADDPFLAWFRSQEKKFEKFWEMATDQIFHLLFANRTFLLTFNQSLGKFVSDNMSSGKHFTIPIEYLDNKGKIARRDLPTWAQNAVFYRDQGKCVLCQKDISGLIRTDDVKHLDHIVPLNLWGTNDPANLQLLCEDCNLHKGGKSAATDFWYPSWW